MLHHKSQNGQENLCFLSGALEWLCIVSHVSAGETGQFKSRLLGLYFLCVTLHELELLKEEFKKTERWRSEQRKDCF